MRCKYCGHSIPEGMLYCENCGKEVCIVPEYNPLDDLLSEAMNRIMKSFIITVPAPRPEDEEQIPCHSGNALVQAGREPRLKESGSFLSESAGGSRRNAVGR